MTTQSTPHPRDVGIRWTNARLSWLALGVILLLALVPRVSGLGDAPLWIDEDLTWLATRGVMETGTPQLPSGALYPRAPLYTYLATAFVVAGDGSNFALRLPSVLASLGLITVVFLFGRALGGNGVGLTAAVIVAFSPWDVHYARMARMYELLVFLFTATVYLAYLGLMRGSRPARVGMLVTAALALGIHQQAAMLAIVFLAPALFPRRVRPPVRWILAGFLVTALAYVAVAKLGDHGFSGSYDLDVVGRDRNETNWVVPGLGIVVDLNHARFLLLDAFRASPLVGVVAGLAVAAVGAWNVVRLQRDGKSLSALAAVAFGIALLANQLFIAALLALVTVKLAESTVSGGIRRGVELGGTAVLSTAILLGATALALGAEALTDRMVLRSFLALPVPWYKRLFLTYPFTFVVALLGIAVYYLRSLRPGNDHRSMYLILAFALPLVVQGIVYSPYFAWRYNFYLSPLLVLIFATSVLPIAHFLTKAIEPRLRRFAIATAMVGVVTVLLCDVFAPAEAFRVSQRAFGRNLDLFDHPDLTASYNYDFPNTAAYVDERRAPGDVVIVRDPVNLYPYLGRADYVVSADYDGLARNAAGEAVDFYIGIPYIGSARELARVLDAHADVTRWIIYTTGDGERGPFTKLTRDQLDYLTELKPYRVFTGEDNTTVVVKIPPGTPAPPPGRVIAEPSAAR